MSFFLCANLKKKKQEQYFLSGSFDKKLRIWNIPERRVVEWAQTSVFITAVGFTPSGKMAIAGLFNGECMFYQTEGLRYYTQVKFFFFHLQKKKKQLSFSLWWKTYKKKEIVFFGGQDLSFSNIQKKNMYRLNVETEEEIKEMEEK